MNKIYLSFFWVFALLTQLNGSEINPGYAQSTSYALSDTGYVHIAQYDNLQVFTNVELDHFGEQIIFSLRGEELYRSEYRNDYVFYPFFFILVNYYDAFQIVTVSPWGFDGLDPLIHVNKQYIEFYGAEE